MECREKLDYTFRILNPVNTPIQTMDAERNKTIVDYTRKEVELYDSCSNRVEDFVKASKFWGKLANPDGTVNSAYGYLIWNNKSHGNDKYEFKTMHVGNFNNTGPKDVPIGNMRTPWEWAKESLLNDKDTRQAILRFSLPEHAWMGVKDFTCTMHGIFFIRDDKLHFSVNMRSNDLMLGLVYDMPWFISLMDKMIVELKDKYPNLTKGHYTHTVHSMHIYARDKEKILKMIGET
jgi:thymidylate synthase